jgi:hypothetical protein
MRIKLFEGFNDPSYTRISWGEWKSGYENKYLQLSYRHLIRITEVLDRLKCPWGISLCLEKKGGGISHVDITTKDGLIKNRTVIENLKPYGWNNNNPSLHLYMYPYKDLRKGSYETINLAEDDWFIIRFDRYVVDGVGSYIADDGRKMYHDLEIWKCDQLEGLIECLEYLIRTKDEII